MRLSVVTDELSADLETALELARSFGVDGIELRGVGERRYPEVGEFWRARVPQLVREAGLPVAAISPGLFKIPYPEGPDGDTRILRWEDAMVFRRTRDAEALLRHHLESLLPAAIDAAVQLGSPTIVAFSFDRPPGPSGRAPEAVVDALREAARRVGQAGLTLAIEVEHICWGDTASHTADLVRRVAEPALGINWDPANAFRGGDDRPYPDGYAHVRDVVRHVHFKDAAVDMTSGERRFTFDGVIDWSGQIDALGRDGYTGFVSVESHARPKVELTRRYIERLRTLGAAR